MRRTKRICGIAMVLVVLCSACRERKAILYESSEDTASLDLAETLQEEERPAEEESVFVYVCGQVQNPGVYELPREARVEAAIEAAGGMMEAAADTYLNLAEHIQDGQKIEVPTEEEAELLSENEAQQQEEKVNLNKASAEQLMTLPGIGASKAEAILDYREQHGGFTEVTELMEIPGIKEGVFQKIQDYITV